MTTLEHFTVAFDERGNMIPRAACLLVAIFSWYCLVKPFRSTSIPLFDFGLQSCGIIPGLTSHVLHPR